MSADLGGQQAETTKLVEALTRSGKQAVDPEIMKKLKALCRTSDDLLKHAHYLLRLELQKDDANVRYCALLVVDELFRRSHIFRTLILGDLQSFLELVLETNPDLPLPAPVSTAKELKRKAAHIVGCWQEQFGPSYRVLALAANFLRRCKHVALGSDPTEARIERNNAERLLSDISERTPEVEALLTQLENCLELIVPPPDSCDGCGVSVPESASDVAATGHGNDLNAHGMGPTFSLEVSLEPRVFASGDNAVLLQTLADQRRELSSVFLPRVKRWLQSLAKISHPAVSEALRSTIDLKRRLEAALNKCNELHIEEEASTDDDLDEVPEKEGFEPVIPQHRRAEYGLDPLPCEVTSAQSVAKEWSLCGEDEEASDPTSRQAQLQKLAQKLATSSNSGSMDAASVGSNEPISVAGPSRASDVSGTTGTTSGTAGGSKKDVAPRRHYDLDLYYWEDENIEAPSLTRSQDLHNFWSAAELRDAPETAPEEWSAALRQRRIDFSGEFVPVKWSCRAPLPSGKLCPRRDRYKCPFHGPIVPRDSMGQPQGEEASKVDEKRQKASRPDWQDPGLLRDLEAATGVNLEVGKTSKGKRKKKSVAPESPRKRLEKKIFNKRSVQRVAGALDTIDSRKFEDKFGNQWNYAFNT
ncbi:UV-stimulated scaffold protein A-like [Ornithodoros turicata]|uniref:UV-stimulated scaffold protein A-like n=1 Tax=Ornithodoros turicata TaxID=34597 RepID=UPI003139DE1F